MLQQVESHLRKNKVKPSDLNWPDWKIPGDVQAILETGGYGNVTGAAGTDPQLEAKLKTLQVEIKQLEETEVSLQNYYWKLRIRFPSR